MGEIKSEVRSLNSVFLDGFALTTGGSSFAMS